VGDLVLGNAKPPGERQRRRVTIQHPKPLVSLEKPQSFRIHPAIHLKAYLASPEPGFRCHEGPTLGRSTN
jgi:hypothetical protein